MGYRSTVGAMFYTQDETKVGVVKLWLRENLPFSDWDTNEFEEIEDGFRFCASDIKWYGTFLAVERFYEIAEKFKDMFCMGETPAGAYEFVRVGEETTDIEEDSAGDHDYRVRVSVDIVFD